MSNLGHKTRQLFARLLRTRVQIARTHHLENAAGELVGLNKADVGKRIGEFTFKSRIARRPPDRPVAHAIGGRLGMENTVKSRRHKRSDLGDFGIELGKRHSHHLGNACALCIVLRQNLRLLVIDILQAMLKIAQEHIVAIEPFGRLLINAAACGTSSKHGPRGLASKFRFAASADDLESLANEFDFPNAAASELNVGAAVLDGFLAGRFRTDHLMNLRKSTDGAEVNVLAKHERPHQRIEVANGLRKVLFTRKNAAVDNASFEPGKALPVATFAVEILFEHCRGNHQRTAVAEGTQTHVDAKHKTGTVNFVNRSNHTSCQTVKELVVRHLSACRSELSDCLRFAAFVVDEDQINVGTDVKFLPAEFAHADDKQILRFTRDAHRHAEALRKLSGVHPHGRRNGFFGQRRHRAHDFMKISVSGQVTNDQRRHHFPAQLTHDHVEHFRIIDFFETASHRLARHRFLLKPLD